MHMQYELALGPLLSPREEEDRRRMETLPSEAADLYSRGWDILRAHHAAVMRADAAAVDRHRDEMRDLTCRLNGGDSFACECEGGGAWRMRRELAATAGQVPMRGQSGHFLLLAGGCRVLVEFNYLCGHFCDGFGAHAVDASRPFFSETGFRSFILCPEALPGMGQDAASYAKTAIEAYIANDLKGRLVALEKPERLAASLAGNPDNLPGAWLAEALAHTPLPPLPPPPVPAARKPRRQGITRAQHLAAA